MTRRYDDPVEVRRRDDEPEQFLWRGRLFVVQDVLARWVETTAWWRGPAARAALSLDPPAERPAPWRRAAGDGLDPAGAAPAPAPVGPALAVAEGAEREIWRVEAGSGRAHGSGVYDLCFDWAEGSWTLLRSLD
jgi:hypothetical protein